MRLAATGYQGHDRIVDFQLFHSRMIRTVVGGGGRTCLKQTKKELSTKGHEERRRATKALRLTATGYQGHERIVDFRLFHSRMIRPVGRGPDLSETNEKRVIHEGPRRTTKGHEGVEVNRDGIPRSRKDCRFLIVSLSYDPHTVGRGPDLSETNEKRVIHEGPRRTTKGHEGVEVNRDGMPKSRRMIDF